MSATASSDVQAARQRLEQIGKIVAPPETLSVTNHEPDNRILECSVECRSQSSSPKTCIYYG